MSYFFHFSAQFWTISVESFTKSKNRFELEQPTHHYFCLHCELFPGYIHYYNNDGDQKNEFILNSRIITSEWACRHQFHNIALVSCMEPVTVTSWIVKITKISSNILIQKVLPASFEVPFYQGKKKEAFSTFWGLMGSLSRNDILSLLAAPPGKRVSVLHTQLLSLLLLCITIKHYGAKNTKKGII